MRLNAGDAVLLPHGSFHVLASAPDVPAVEIDSLSRVAVADNIYVVDDPRGAPNDAGADMMFCGALRFNLDALHPLIAMMPPVMLASDLAQKDATVPALLDAMEREVALDRIGACGILARLADALAASILRAWVECGCSDATGWIAAVRCPKVGKVVAAIHADPERGWTLPELADVMGASRSTFATPSRPRWAKARRSALPRSRCSKRDAGSPTTACASRWQRNGWATSRRHPSAARSSASSGMRRAQRAVAEVQIRMQDISRLAGSHSNAWTGHRPVRPMLAS